MNHERMLLFCVLSVLFFGVGMASQAPATQPGAIKAGAALRSDLQPVPLAEALANPERYKGQLVRLEGKIEQVCPKRGCWLILEDGDARARVTFKDYGFFVPTDSKGRRVRLDAHVARTTISKEWATHLESETDGGNPDAIDGPQEVVSIVADGVEILDTPPDK